jgi:hypothetical protein
MKNQGIAVGLAVAAFGLVAWQQAPIENDLKQAETLIGVRALAGAVNMYAADFDGIYPNPHDLNGLKVVVAPYVEEKGFWKTLNPSKSELRFNLSLGGVAKADVKEPEKTLLIYESNPWPNRQRPVAFVDGSARLVNPVQFGQVAITLATRLERKAQPLPKELGKLWKEDKPVEKKKDGKG